MDRFIKLDDSYIEQMADLYRNAFAGDPWNDDWSDTNQLMEYTKEISGSYNALNYGLVREGRLIAMSLGQIRHWWQGTNYNIEELCVDPSLQGQGIGSHFLKLIDEEISMQGMAGIFLQTDSDKPSYGFYKKNGFKELAEHVSFYRNCRRDD